MKRILATVLCAVLSATGPAIARLPADVVPMEDWSKFSTVHYGRGPVSLHLRTGYQRPLIMPEPVSWLVGADLAGLVVEVDTEVVIFSPTDHFKRHALQFRGLQSGKNYRLEVRADTLGSRIPTRLEQ